MPPRRWLLGALVVLGVALAWQLGHRRGVEDGARAMSRSIAARDEASAAIAVERRERHEAELAALARERDIARATIETLSEELESRGELAAEERAELELYRRIGGEESSSGLAIDAIERRAGPPATLAVTLVQARGRERVAGRVEVDPAGRDGSAVAGADGGPAWSADFDLRFFETLEIPLERLGEPFPEAIVVSVTPDEGGRHKPFRRLFGRETIRTAD